MGVSSLRPRDMVNRRGSKGVLLWTRRKIVGKELLAFYVFIVFVLSQWIFVLERCDDVQCG